MAQLTISKVSFRTCVNDQEIVLNSFQVLGLPTSPMLMQETYLVNRTLNDRLHSAPNTSIAYAAIKATCELVAHLPNAAMKALGVLYRARRHCQGLLLVRSISIVYVTISEPLAIDQCSQSYPFDRT